MGQLVVEDGSILRIDLITLYGQVECFTFQVVGGITYLQAGIVQRKEYPVTPKP